MMAWTYAAGGRRLEALNALDVVVPLATRLHSAATVIAMVYTLMHDSNKALSWLEEAYKQHDQNLVFLKVFPDFDSLHSDPRFQDLVRRIGIPSS